MSGFFNAKLIVSFGFGESNQFKAGVLIVDGQPSN